MHRPVLRAVLPALAAALCMCAPAAAAPATLRAGAGQADITPPKTGYYLGGWTRADRVAKGQSTRLYANTLVLQRGGQKVALVAVELFSVAAGMQEDVARAVHSLGYDTANVLMAASHTHSGPGGFSNNPLYNTAAPSPETIGDPASFIRFFDSPPADRQLYTFLVNQIALSIRRADRDLAPAAAAWGHDDLTGLTQNRSIEAHLADHGIHVATGSGNPGMDPLGVDDTIDPNVDVLRVDKLVRRHGHTVRMPIGAWSNFADHGTVVHSELQAYTGDHHASAWRTFAAKVRRSAHVPRSQAVVNVYPNSDEGDQTAGIVRFGPAAANFVGDTEAAAMFGAWKAAGKKLSRTPALGLRWTRTCFCGRPTPSGNVAAKGVVGAGFLTGSEEGRGPLYDLTGISFEGRTNPIPDPVQGDKIGVPIGNPPPAVPIAVLRVGDHAIATIPGEPTKQIGTRVKAAVLAKLAAQGVKRVVIAGLAYDFIQYVTTPEEYGTQSYEGASTLYGPNEGPFLQQELAGLAGDLAAGKPAPAPYALDTSYGVKPDGAPYPSGAMSGTITGQPAASYQRLGHANLAFDGGANGADRPVDAAFIYAQRRVGSAWKTLETDLGVTFLWRADAQGHYTVTWEIPISAPAGDYRFVVTANHYRLQSRPFAVKPLDSLVVDSVPAAPGRVAVSLRYPAARPNVDLTARPPAAAGGTVRFSVAGRPVTVRSDRGTVFGTAAAAGSDVSVPAGAARDRYGNTNGASRSLR